MSFEEGFRNYTIDLGIRLILWTLFLILDQMDPFIRVIRPEEMWLYKYPVKESYVSVLYLWLFVFTVPLSVILYDYSKNKDKFETSQALLTISLIYGLNGVFTTLIKNLVGRPRPDFYHRCFPDGLGNERLECTGRRADTMEGRKSFPSGHASFAFCSMVFVSLYLSGKLQVFNSNKRGDTLRLTIVLIPIMAATAIAISRTCDYHHHYSDVIAGSILGTVIAYICYRQYYPNVTSDNSSVSYSSQSIKTSYKDNEKNTIRTSEKS